MVQQQISAASSQSIDIGKIELDAFVASAFNNDQEMTEVAGRLDQTKPAAIARAEKFRADWQSAMESTLKSHRHRHGHMNWHRQLPVGRHSERES